jgi:hypothetical protein
MAKNIEEQVTEVREFANDIFGNTDISAMQIREMLKELQEGLDEISGVIDVMLDTLED